jgi:LPS export ABC transporter protein LptC
LTLSILILAFCLASCAAPTAQNEVQAAEGKPDVTFFGFSREEVENGIVVFTAKAQRAEYFEDQRLIVIYGVAFSDMGQDGLKPVSTGEADKVVYHEDTGNAEFSGYVRVRSLAEEASFETDSLIYNSSTQTIEGPAGNPVIVKVGLDLIIKGTGLFADIRAKAFSFRNGVTGTISTGTTGTTVREGE